MEGGIFWCRCQLPVPESVPSYPARRSLLLGLPILSMTAAAAARRRRWNWRLRLAPVRCVALPDFNSVRPSTSGCYGRSRIESDVSAFGEERAKWRAPFIRLTSASGMVALSMFPYQTFGWFDSASVSVSAPAPAATAGARTENMSVPSTHVDPKGACRQPDCGPWTYSAN